MSVPEKPITRKDMFYDGILTGNTVPEPITREEMYLDAIAKKDAQGGSVNLSNYIQKSEISEVMKEYGINSKLQIADMNTAIESKLSKSSIVKLDSMADFENLTDKTADFYFIKED